MNNSKTRPQTRKHNNKARRHENEAKTNQNKTAEQIHKHMNMNSDKGSFLTEHHRLAANWLLNPSI